MKITPFIEIRKNNVKSITKKDGIYMYTGINIINLNKDKVEGELFKLF